MSDLVVRQAEASDSDRQAMATLRRAWAEEDAGGPIDDPGFEPRAVAWIAANEPHRLGWLAEIAGEPVGLATVVILERMPQPGRRDSAWGYVHHVYVRADRRSSGVGSALMAALVEGARHRGWERLLLHPRPRSIPMYERAGFRVTDHWMVRPLG